MRHLAHNPRAPAVLSVVLRHCDDDILPLMEDTIQEVSCSNNPPEHFTLQSARVLMRVHFSGPVVS